MQPDIATTQIREYPIAFWIFGAIFFTAGALIATSGGGLLIGIIMLLIGVLFFIFSSVTTVRADRLAGVVEISYRSPIKSNRKTIPLAELQTVELETSRGSEGGTLYRLAFTRRSGEKLPLHSYYSSGWKSHEKQAQRLRDLLGLAEPASPTSEVAGINFPAQAVFEPAQTGETAGIPWTVERGKFGNADITRWSCAGLHYPGRFVLLMQKPHASRDLLVGGIGGSISALVYRQLIKMYGFNEIDLPNLDLARPLALNDTPLEQDFTAFTCDPQGAPRLLTAWAVQALQGWAKRRPLPRIQLGEGQTGQLSVLYCEERLYVMTFSTGSSAGIEQELVEVGVALAREARAVAL